MITVLVRLAVGALASISTTFDLGCRGELMQCLMGEPHCGGQTQQRNAQQLDNRNPLPTRTRAVPKVVLKLMSVPELGSDLDLTQRDTIPSQVSCRGWGDRCNLRA